MSKRQQQNDILFEGKAGFNVIGYLYSLFTVYTITRKYIIAEKGLPSIWSKKRTTSTSHVTSIEHVNGLFSSYTKIYFKHRYWPIVFRCSDEEANRIQNVFL